MSEPHFHSAVKTHLQLHFTAGHLCPWGEFWSCKIRNIALIAGLLTPPSAASSWIHRVWMPAMAPLHFYHLILHVGTVVIRFLCLRDLTRRRFAGAVVRENSCVILSEGCLTLPGHNATEKRKGLGGGGQQVWSSGRTAALHSLTHTFLALPLAP